MNARIIELCERLTSLGSIKEKLSGSELHEICDFIFELRDELGEISERLRTQDNRITQNPMFCVQIKRRDVGYDAAYSDRRCWRDSANEITIYDDDPDFKEPEGEEWDEFGYLDRWETVMVAFTEVGCEEYLQLNGHNDRSRAFRGEVQIYVESFNRCPEMIAIREALMK